MRRLRRALVLVAINLLVLAVLLALVEGGSSLLLFARAARHAPPIAERLHTAHDPVLGWMNRPGVHVSDMYGPGIGLTINAQGFRGTEPTSARPPAGRLRVTCSGDSFTLGYGVADDQTWCHQMTVLDPRLATVNMGQGGYGFDQAWLWYRRDGAALGERVQVFAFISDDFRRMQDDRFLGYAKPKLALRGDSLVVANAPVPGPPGAVASWFRRHAEAVNSLRTVQLVRRLGARLRGPATAPSADSARAAVRPVVAAIIADLAARHAANGSHLMLVHLPTRYELEGHFADIGREWGAFVAHQASADSVTFLDLFPVFRKLGPTAWDSLFLGAGAVEFPAAAGHYTAAGNALVAREIHDELVRRGWLTMVKGEW